MKEFLRFQMGFISFQTCYEWYAMIRHHCVGFLHGIHLFQLDSKVSVLNTPALDLLGQDIAIKHMLAHQYVMRRDEVRGLTLIELLVVLVILIAVGGIVVPIFGRAGEGAREQATRATLSQVAEAIVGPDGYAQVMQFARNQKDDQFVGHATGLPWPSPAEVAAGRADHPQLHYLFQRPTDLKVYGASASQRFYDPVQRIGWRDRWLSPTTATAYSVVLGDNFTTSYGEGDGPNGTDPDDLAPVDGWGNPVVIQLPTVSSGITAEEVEHVRLISAGRDGVIDTPANKLTPTAVEKNDDLVLYLYRGDPNP